MKKCLSILVMLVILVISANVLAGDPSAEIRNLEQQVQALRQSMIQNNTGPAQFSAQLQEIQSQIESLKGTVESTSHAISAVTQNTDIKLRDMESRMASIEEKLQIQTKQITSAVSSVAPGAAAEGEMYQLALNQINNSEYLKSIATLKKFQQKFPKSEYMAASQYWIGECYFAMRDYETAIKQFQVVRDKYPRSDKAPAAMLKQGYAFIELNMESDGKLFLNELIAKYPRSKEAAEAKERMQRASDLKANAKPTTDSSGVQLAPGLKSQQDKVKK